MKANRAQSYRDLFTHILPCFTAPLMAQTGYNFASVGGNLAEPIVPMLHSCVASAMSYDSITP